MEFYNLYLRPNRDNQIYKSRIVFIDHPNGIVQKNLFYVEFKDSSKSGFYYDDDNYLQSIYSMSRKTGFAGFTNDNSEFWLDKTSNLIRNASSCINYYSYVKIINDKQNPQLNGNIMILKFGYKIRSIINNIINFRYCDSIFEINIESVRGYPNYDRSHFTDEPMHIIDNSLNDLNSYLNFKTINCNTLIRKEKLQKLQQSIDDIDEYIFE